MKLFVALLMFLLPFTAIADNYRLVALKHRSALDLQERLTVLVADNTSISVDGNQLLLRGPASDVNQLVAMIKQLDKPRHSLRVSVYRGKTPYTGQNPYETIAWSTDVGQQNRFDTAVIEEDTTLRITDRELTVLSTDGYISNSHVARNRVIGNSITGSAGNGVTRNNVTRNNVTRNNVTRNNVTRNHVTEGRIVESYRQSGESQARYRENNHHYQSKAIEITPSLLLGNKVSLAALLEAPAQSHVNRGKETVVESTRTTLKRAVALGQWFVLSSHQQHAQPQTLTSRRQVSSTRKAHDFDRSIWIKIEKVD